MSRVPDLDPQAMSAEQQRLYAEIKGPRGNVGGPFALWIRLPQVADAANRFGNALRLDGKLDRRLFELMVLVVARHWTSQFEWHTHEKYALEGGITPEAIDAIRHRRVPDFEREDEQLVYDVVTELSESKALSAETYARAYAYFGEELLVELISAAGLYTMVAMMLNAFDAPIPDSARRLV